MYVCVCVCVIVVVHKCVFVCGGEGGCGVGAGVDVLLSAHAGGMFICMKVQVWRCDVCLLMLFSAHILAQIVGGCDLNMTARGMLASPAAVARLKIVTAKAIYIIATKVLIVSGGTTVVHVGPVATVHY